MDAKKYNILKDKINYYFEEMHLYDSKFKYKPLVAKVLDIDDYKLTAFVVSFLIYAILFICGVFPDSFLLWCFVTICYMALSYIAITDLDFFKKLMLSGATGIGLILLVIAFICGLLYVLFADDAPMIIKGPIASLLLIHLLISHLKQKRNPNTNKKSAGKAWEQRESIKKEIEYEKKEWKREAFRNDVNSFLEEIRSKFTTKGKD